MTFSAWTPWSVVTTLGAVLLAILAYELVLRAWLLGKVREALHRRSQRFTEKHGVRLDPFKFGGRLLVKEELLNDPQVNAAMLEAARGGQVWKKGDAPRPPVPPLEVRKSVEEYIDEIVPAFSLAAYYQFGLGLAKFAVNAVYRPVIDRASQERLRSLPKDATAVFLINHRSNFDYVVVGWALARQVAVSYAVGEWARVFPLDALFKAFGGFFVRRGFPDPLYHLVLRRYLQLITRRGVTQGIFPEGGLTRDGALRAPKAGLLEAILALTVEPGFDRELYFVPVGINYDRVLEDGHLLAEKRGRDRPPTIGEKTLGILKALVLTPWRLLVNGLRVATGRLQKSGYVAVAFGPAIRWSDFAREHKVDLNALTPDERRGAAKQVAAELMKEIARCIPATPVPLVAKAMLELGETDRSTLSRRVGELRAQLEKLGVPVALGEEFAGHRAEREKLASEPERNRDLARMEGELLDGDEAEAIARLGVGNLAGRGLLVLSGDRVAVGKREHTAEVLGYYAKSLSVLDPGQLADPATR